MTEQHLPVRRAESLPAFDPTQPRAMIVRGLARLAAQPLGGTLKWRFMAGDRHSADVLIMGKNGLLHVSPSRPHDIHLRRKHAHVWALDLSTGRPSWTFAADGITGIDNGVVRVKRGKETIDGTGTICGLDEMTGRELWRCPVGSLLGSLFLEPGIETICLKESQGGIRAIAALTGAEIWRSNVAEIETHFPLFWTTANGIIYAESSNGRRRYEAPHTIYAIDAATGMEVWRFLNAELDHTQVMVEAGTIYFWGTALPVQLKDRGRGWTSRYDTTLYALDATTGETRWKWTAHSRLNIRIANGLVYCSSQGKVIHVLDSETGGDVGHEAAAIPSRAAAGTYWADNMVYLPAARGEEGRGMGYPGDGLQQSYVSALDATTWVEQWRFAAEGHSVNTIAVLNGLVFVWFTTEDENWNGEEWGGTGTLYGLDAATGAERLRVARIALPTVLPTLIDSLVFIVTTVYDDDNEDFTRIFAIDTRDGSERWGRLLFWNNHLIVNNRVLYLVSDAEEVCALEASTGVERWKFATEGSYVRSLIADGETIYLSSGGNVYAIHAGIANEQR